jgi:hypothetical protein
VPYPDFGPFVGALSQTVKALVQAMVKQSGRFYLYLESSTRSKEKVAQTIADRGEPGTPRCPLARAPGAAR